MFLVKQFVSRCDVAGIIIHLFIYLSKYQQEYNYNTTAVKQ